MSIRRHVNHWTVPPAGVINRTDILVWCCNGRGFGSRSGHYQVEMTMEMGFSKGMGKARWESHGNGNWSQNWEWE